VTTLVQLIAEACRLRLMRGLEESLESCGFARIAGVDDSKQLTPEEREAAALMIRRTAIAWTVIAIDADTIDRINILEAAREAMRRCLAALRPRPDCAVVDAVAVRGLPFPCLPVVRGDQVSYAVACGSILAKVARDRLMTELDAHYPQYGFAAHKGYAAPEHLRALAEFGPTPIHRLTFRGVVPRYAEVLA
jgi:ribonuclease HII